MIFPPTLFSINYLYFTLALDDWSVYINKVSAICYVVYCSTLKMVVD
jgi:hypothetical protein